MFGKHFYKDEIFNQKDFSQSLVPKGEYEDCAFNNCYFTSSNLSLFSFTNCRFNDCNLSLATLEKTCFREVEFTGCKLLGLRFETCNPFGLSFTFNNCLLSHSSFYKMKLQKIIFNDTHLPETDLTECDLTGATFNNCELANSIFFNTILDKADFTTAYNYSINPEINRLKKAKFSLAGISGLLHQYDIEITS